MGSGPGTEQLLLMDDGWMNAADALSLARQAAALLYDNAEVTTLPPEHTVGMHSVFDFNLDARHSIFRFAVSVGNSSGGVVRVDAGWPSEVALGNLLLQLEKLCKGRFRGRAFPPCLDHVHSAIVEIGPGVVQLRCPAAGQIVATIEPSLPDN